MYNLNVVYLYFRIDHLYAFFLRWNPEGASNSIFDDNRPADSHTLSTPTNRPSPYSPSKHNEMSPGKGFVLLANDDPELTGDYSSTSNKNNNSSKNRTATTSSDSGIELKKQHYLKRQNTLLKEWEVIISFPGHLEL
jgi:hypothetical protein